MSICCCSTFPPAVHRFTQPSRETGTATDVITATNKPKQTQTVYQNKPRRSTVSAGDFGRGNGNAVPSCPAWLSRKGWAEVCRGRTGIGCRPSQSSVSILPPPRCLVKSRPSQSSPSILSHRYGVGGELAVVRAAAVGWPVTAATDTGSVEAVTGDGGSVEAVPRAGRPRSLSVIAPPTRGRWRRLRTESGSVEAVTGDTA